MWKNEKELMKKYCKKGAEELVLPRSNPYIPDKFDLLYDVVEFDGAEVELEGGQLVQAGRAYSNGNSNNGEP